MSEAMHERDLAATDEMIRNLRAGTFRKVAIGIGVAGAALLTGASLLVWTYKHGNDPEAFKEALRHMPPLNVTVTLDPDSRTVKLEQPAMVRLEQLSVMPSAANTSKNNGNDPAIQTSVTVFKTVPYKGGYVFTGWRFANGAARTPESQYCHYKRFLGEGNSAIQSVGDDGKQMPAPTGVMDQSERFAHCQWFNGDLT
jgi:hypothetical protein